jgi:hypothetical protein
MNLVFSSTWYLAEKPSVQTVLPNPYMNVAIYPRMDLAAPVNPFILKAPIPLSANEFIEIPFGGGTLHDLLLQIYRFYQEPVTLKEIEALKECPLPQASLVRLGEHEQELMAGCRLKRLDILDCQDARFGSIENGYLIAWLD